MSTIGKRKRSEVSGDPYPELIDGDAEDIQETLELVCNNVPSVYIQVLDRLESKEIGKKKQLRKQLDWMVLMTIGYLCRNYKLGNLDPKQVCKFEIVMLDFVLLVERLHKNNVKIPSVILEQLKDMGLFEN